MKHLESQLSGPNGLSVYYQYWKPDEHQQDHVSKVILIVHGLGEHSGRYEHVAERLTAQGWVVATLDLPGHGQSSGRKCCVESIQDYLDAVRLVHKRVLQDFENSQLVLLGHSMGGLISSLYLLEHQKEFQGCVLSGPAIKADPQPGWLQKKIINLVSAVAPNTGVLQLDAAGVSRDSNEVEKYLADPLVFNGKISARLVVEIFSGMQRVADNARSITLPILLMHGEKDTLVTPQSSRFLHDAVGSEDKALKMYPELFHEIFNEPEKEQVIDDMIRWCQRIFLKPHA